MKAMNTKELVIMAALTAVLFAGQVAMAFLPNIEITTLLVIVYTQIYRRKVFFIIYAFAFLEGLFYGFGVWWVSYLYIWSLLAVITLVFAHYQAITFWSIVSGFFGLSFGALCSIPYVISGGWAAGFGYWIAGIPYDVVHCAGNVVLCAVLYKPLLLLMRKLVQTYNM